MNENNMVYNLQSVKQAYKEVVPIGIQLHMYSTIRGPCTIVLCSMLNDIFTALSFVCACKALNLFGMSGKTVAQVQLGHSQGSYFLPTHRSCHLY